MKILFITATRIGDAVLSTGILRHIRETYPQAKVTIVTGALCVSLFEAYPLLDKIISLKKQKWNKHWLDLWQQVSKTKWDMVIDMRNSAVSRIVSAKQRFIFTKKFEGAGHKVEQAAALLKLSAPPATELFFTKEQQDKAAAIIPQPQKTIAIGPTANWIGKTWPAERFIEIAKWLTAPEGLFPDYFVAVIAAPGEEDVGYKVFNALPENRRIDVIAKTNPATAAAVLNRCQFYIGNDSGLMHCAAACGVPTVGLFGPTLSNIYSPWGPCAALVRTPESYEELTGFEGYNAKTLDRSLMTTLTVDAVKERISEFMQRKTTHETRQAQGCG